MTELSRGSARLALLAAAALGLVACASQQQLVENRENMLAAAGFRQHPATTPEKVRTLYALPPNRIVRRIDDDHVTFLYADPLVCVCLWTGGQEAWGRYQMAVQQQRIADEQIEAAQLNSEAGWDWGPWGGFGPGFY